MKFLYHIHIMTLKVKDSQNLAFPEKNISGASISVKTIYEQNSLDFPKVNM